MRRITILILLAVLGAHAGVSAAEREWQTGTWSEAKVERPRVQFSARTSDPNSPLPRTAAAREWRIYVIETNTLRLELRQDATADTPRMNVVLGQPVTFAIDKKTVYVKDEEGREHRLSLRKQSALASPQTK